MTGIKIASDMKNVYLHITFYKSCFDFQIFDFLKKKKKLRFRTHIFYTMFPTFWYTNKIYLKRLNS